MRFMCFCQKSLFCSATSHAFSATTITTNHAFYAQIAAYSLA